MSRSTDVADTFPILCDSCLGSNKFIRMTKDPFGEACKVCNRPYDVFKWRAAADGHLKQTECCQLCAKIKNICSTCMLDLEFKLPSQIRDAVLEPDEIMRVPTSHANREFMFEQHEKRIMGAGDHVQDQVLALPYGKANPASILDRIESRKPFYKKRNLQNICKDYLKGICTRGSSCPYLHHAPLSDKTTQDELMERFRAENAPPDRSGEAPPIPPANQTITTIFVGGNDNTISEDDLVAFFSTYGHVASVRAIPSKNVAFVEFMDRSAADAAVAKLWKKCVIKSVPVRIAWARPRAPQGDVADAVDTTHRVSHEDANRHLSVPPPPVRAASIPPPPGMYGKRRLYPSQNPKFGSAKLS
ncbi:RNA recognition motif containing protein [Plasmodiophora brassicae]